MMTDAFVAHALPRRVRIRAPSLVDHHDACERVARDLASAFAPVRVSVRPRTGSIVVEREEAGVDLAPLDADAIARRVATRIAAEPEPAVATPRRETRLARAIEEAAAGINADVARALENRADLRALLPFALGTGGLAEILTTGRLPIPDWFNLFWWALSSFHDLNEPHAAPVEDAAGI